MKESKGIIIERPLLVIFIVALIGLGVMLAVFLFYVFGGGFSKGLSKASGDWGTFGDFFGGIINPVFGLINIIILAITLLQQEFQLVRSSTNNLKQELLATINKIDDDIRNVLSKQVVLQRGITVSLGDLVDGFEKGTAQDSFVFKALLNKLRTLVIRQQEAIKLYSEDLKDSDEIHFLVREFSKRANEIEKFILDNHSTT